MQANAAGNAKEKSGTPKKRKKTYHTPELRYYGTVKELTTGSTGARGDGFANHSRV
jgi:hypothetical protein